LRGPLLLEEKAGCLETREGAGTIGAAVMVARIATGEVEDTKGKAPEIGPRAARLAAERPPTSE